MKRYKIETRTNRNECWDADSVQDYIEAESKEEAIELAKDYLKECCIQNDEEPEQIDEWEIKAEVVEPTEIEILMADRCTRKEAEKYLLDGTTIYDDFEENFDSYMKEWDWADEEDIASFKKMIETKKPIRDWGVVELYEKTYYIMYAL